MKEIKILVETKTECDRRDSKGQQRREEGEEESKVGEKCVPSPRDWCKCWPIKLLLLLFRCLSQKNGVVMKEHK